MLVVSPKTTCPTSTVMLGWALTYSASGATFDENESSSSIAAAIAVELDVGHVPAMALQDLHGLERRRPVAGKAEVVGVDVHRMRQLQLVDRLGDRLDDLSRRHAEVVDGRIDGVDVAGRMALPDLDAAGIDELGGIRLRRRQEPADRAP